MPGITERIIERLAGSYIERRIAEAVTIDDDKYWHSLTANGSTDLLPTVLRENQLEALEAYRANPLAFRIVELMTDYVLGKGLTITCKPKTVDTFVQEFWSHRLNNMDARLHDWARELTISGELFLTFHHNPIDGMTYVRSVPATLIDDIETNPDDIEDERRFHQVATPGRSRGDGSVAPTVAPTDASINGRWWTSGEMRHYAVNRPSGALRGQGDLVPILPWLRRYKEWLTDRVVINKYKGAYLWDVTLTGATASTIKAKISEIAANPPSAGAVRVHNETEVWAAIQPEIDAQSAADDGLALRLMIATGAGVPLHYLSEGAANSLATAKEMGEPTRRHYEKRQRELQYIVKDVLRQAIENKWQENKRHTITTIFPDLTTSDNTATANALSTAVDALTRAEQAGYIDFQTAQQWLFRFAEERQADDPDGDTKHDPTRKGAPEGAPKPDPVQRRDTTPPATPIPGSAA